MQGLKFFTLLPCRKLLKSTLHQNEGVNKERERYGILKIICAWDPVQMRSEGDPLDKVREQVTRQDWNQLKISGRFFSKI